MPCNIPLHLLFFFHIPLFAVSVFLSSNMKIKWALILLIIMRYVVTVVSSSRLQTVPSTEEANGGNWSKFNFVFFHLCILIWKMGVYRYLHRWREHRKKQKAESTTVTMMGDQIWDFICASAVACGQLLGTEIARRVTGSWLEYQHTNSEACIWAIYLVVDLMKYHVLERGSMCVKAQAKNFLNPVVPSLKKDSNIYAPTNSVWHSLYCYALICHKVPSCKPR